MFGEEIARIRKLGVHGVLFQLLNLLNVVASGLMMWKALCLVTNSESPIVVVLSGSMEPAFYRGDILFLTNPANTPFDIGDITVYKVPGDPNGTPIVHRVIESHLSPNGSQMLLTKGDNNGADDVALYRGPEWLDADLVVGKVQGFLPYVGYVTIAMNDFPQLKVALLGGVAIFLLLNKDHSYTTDQTLEQQNEEELSSLHNKIKNLRSVTIDILDDSGRQNNQLDQTNSTFSQFANSLLSTSRHHGRSIASNSTLRQYRTIAWIVGAVVALWLLFKLWHVGGGGAQAGEY
ncbi:hypothetical protein CcaverHIS002_0608420 [Cutaneotrichosporon cavernicola]|uniref:Signal peptidase complex catalytic subunit SEC11 n=1 Tax=Cutaneotrichosporon cavernicola TaxID=279322 RepID=A0AA48L993_9TREE|nr:uncharacterized protein CcaverHIS019_0607870 [Cutaneotrichosporon cavernicola]BEI86555.1 hypothetical protein CcaverHIS002_0608420 [Cutaneotrichosporon cavernicola]BEI94328.1 hypothetical protein CcaverHIS019_0607870 [Cutaneotrichosporon cavernicola]BEJ02105.1 hypothetical protein CcaverHIS631_0607870 [Cutaneotrichosporon cavernicola]BEJ09867.1 hypothetical protein CcaverHIS641_0607820 [Cutaneotrichosporon cavernicola]